MDTKWISRPLLLASLIALSFFISPQSRATGEKCFDGDGDDVCTTVDGCLRDQCVQTDGRFSGVCTATPDDTLCVPANACQTNGKCDSNSSAADHCVFEFVPGCCQANGDCDDNDVCNGAETCAGNNCQAGTPLHCDDGDPCTTDSCNAVTGCQHIDNGSCNGGGVVPNPPVNNPSDISGGGCSLLAKPLALDLRDGVLWFALALVMILPLMKSRLRVVMKRWRRN